MKGILTEKTYCQIYELFGLKRIKHMEMIYMLTN